MTPFLLVSRSVEYEVRLRRLLGDRLAVVPGEFVLVGPDAVVERAGDPRIALLGPVLSFEETSGLVERLRERNPGLGLVVVREERRDVEDWVDELGVHAVLSPRASDEITVDLVDRLADWLVAVGDADADDFAVAPGGPAPELVAEIEDAMAAAAVEPAPGDPALGEPAPGEPAPGESAPGETGWEFPPLESGVLAEAIAVVAPKGGQGKTTLSVNLATGLAEVAPNSVVLIDADLQFGDITAALALEPEHTIADAVAADDPLVLKTMLTHHVDGFFVVASAPSPEYADRVTPAALAALIDRLRTLFRYVVVDTTPGLGEHTLVVLEHATDGVFVMNMAVPSLRAVRTEFELLTAIGLMPANRHIVLNFSDRRSGLTVGDVERIIGAPVDVEVPRSPSVLLSANRGVPLIHDDIKDPASRAVRALVQRIDPEAYPTRSRIHRRRRNRESQ